MLTAIAAHRKPGCPCCGPCPCEVTLNFEVRGIAQSEPDPPLLTFDVRDCHGEEKSGYGEVSAEFEVNQPVLWHAPHSVWCSNFNKYAYFAEWRLYWPHTGLQVRIPDVNASWTTSPSEPCGFIATAMYDIELEWDYTIQSWHYNYHVNWAWTLGRCQTDLYQGPANFPGVFVFPEGKPFGRNVQSICVHPDTYPGFPPDYNDYGRPTCLAYRTWPWHRGPEYITVIYPPTLRRWCAWPLPDGAYYDFPLCSIRAPHDACAIGAETLTFPTAGFYDGLPGLTNATSGVYASPCPTDPVLTQCDGPPCDYLTALQLCGG